MFCLLYAHRVLCASEDSPAQKAEKIRSYAFSDTVYGEALPPFRDLMVYIRDHADGDMFICRWIDECVLFLSFVQMTSKELLNPDYTGFLSSSWPNTTPSRALTTAHSTHRANLQTSW